MTDMKFAAIAALGVVAAVPATAPTVLGIPMPLLLACCAGAMFGLAYTPPEKWGRLLAIPNGPPWWRVLVMAARGGGLIFTLATIVFVMGWSAIAAPHVPGFSWTEKMPSEAIGGILSFAGQFWLPRFIDMGNRWLDGKNKTTSKRRGPP